MERRAIVIRGIVQGVGFRPFVFNLATRLRLSGFVKNQTGTVLIEAQGELTALEQFVDELSHRPPPLARIEHLSWEARRPMPQTEAVFRIETSDADGATPVFVSPDVATCADCLAELFDPADRRYRYPFLNCTNCGPRLTIITGAPYDRRRTTMSGFTLCPECRAEYEDPANRRFHAQPTACPACGPQLTLRGADGTDRGNSPEVLMAFAEALRVGQVGALKGLGGYHLVCDATNPAAVHRLRQRKQRDEKPFAVMVRDLADAQALCEVDRVEADLLLSPRRPIVLLRKRDAGADSHSTPPSATRIADPVAPGNPLLGIILPYTPLHYLLLGEMRVPLVMTSGNRSDEPIAYRDDEALTTLGDIADIFLAHDRPIHVRCDDSVMRVVDGVEQPVRRSRGYAPAPIALPFACREPILAVGGQHKATFALGRERQAFLSHHLGDLDHYAAYRQFLTDVELYQDLFAVRPRTLVHDLHPDYATTRYAQDRAAAEGIELLSVQHHHAHMAGCMADHGLNEPVIGATFDGSGFGTDGAVWGGEFLVGDYLNFRRVAHLRYVRLPGGDRAVREPWRMAVAQLLDAQVFCKSLAARVLPQNLSIVQRMAERAVHSPLTSSAGRLFDAVASLAGVRDCVSYEGQAAIELEWLASRVSPAGAYPFHIEEAPAPFETGPTYIIDSRPLIAAISEDVERGTDAAVIARRFHSTMVDMIGAVCEQVRRETNISAAVLSGGVFLNALLASEATRRLQDLGFRVYRHRHVPPNDGGLSLGQLAVAAARASNGRQRCVSAFPAKS